MKVKKAMRLSFETKRPTLLTKCNFGETELPERSPTEDPEAAQETDRTPEDAQVEFAPTRVSGKNPQITTRWRIFCDLDGVLADFESGIIDCIENLDYSPGKTCCKDFGSSVRRVKVRVSIQQVRRKNLDWIEIVSFDLKNIGCVEIIHLHTTRSRMSIR